MINAFCVAIGGALGSLFRYFFSAAVTKFIRIENVFLGKFPFGTLFVNATGSMLAGIFYYFMIRNFDGFDARLKNFLLIGFLGGYTTFSSFCLDFFRLMSAFQYLTAATYIISSVLLSILALVFGFYLMKIIFA